MSTPHDESHEMQRLREILEAHVMRIGVERYNMIHSMLVMNEFLDMVYITHEARPETQYAAVTRALAVLVSTALNGENEEEYIKQCREIDGVRDLIKIELARQLKQGAQR